tara:strand:- start:818 stop:1111 length:294 start_codon:yes stop_codon:yes gene_type:complete
MYPEIGWQFTQLLTNLVGTQVGDEVLLETSEDTNDYSVWQRWPGSKVLNFTHFTDDEDGNTSIFRLWQTNVHGHYLVELGGSRNCPGEYLMVKKIDG